LSSVIYRKTSVVDTTGSALLEQTDCVIKGGGSGHERIGNPGKDVGNAMGKIFDRQLFGAVGIANAEPVELLERLIQLSIFVLPIEGVGLPVGGEGKFEVIAQSEYDNALKKVGALAKARLVEVEKFAHAVDRLQILFAEHNQNALGAADLAHETGDPIARAHGGFIAHQLELFRQTAGEGVDERVAFSTPGVGDVHGPRSSGTLA